MLSVRADPEAPHGGQSKYLSLLAAPPWAGSGIQELNGAWLQIADQNGAQSRPAAPIQHQHHPCSPGPVPSLARRIPGSPQYQKPVNSSLRYELFVHAPHDGAVPW
jgi:hypothetical protein